jgi:hypothetical protein
MSVTRIGKPLHLDPDSEFIFPAVRLRGFLFYPVYKLTGGPDIASSSSIA